MSQPTPILDLVREAARVLSRKRAAELGGVAPGTVERIELMATPSRGTLALLESKRAALEEALAAAAKDAAGTDDKGAQPNASAA